MVKSRVFGDRSTTSSDSKEMQTSGKSDNSYDGPSTSKVEITPKINKEHSSVGKVVWDEIEEVRYRLEFRHSGMGCTADDNVKAWNINVLWNITQQYSITQLRNEVSNHKITHLAVRGKLPPNIHLLAPELTHLCVSDGEGDFINSLSHLQQLETLILSQNRLNSRILSLLRSVPALRELHLEDCRLKALPRSLSHLQQLEKLNLTGNSFRSFKTLDNLQSLRSLRELDLRGCGLKALPDSISKLSKLEELDLWYNDFSSPEALNGLSSLKSLRKLNLGFCSLKSLPDSISKLSKLEELDLKRNDFSSPETLNGLSSLKSLRKLDLGYCRLKSLPDSISKLSKLEELDLVDNDFSSPEALNGLSSLKSLRKLDLVSCKLKSLPDSISELSKLEELNLWGNYFSSPEALNGLSSLKSLRNLNLRLCRLKSLPDSFSHLEKLETLDLSSNRFQLFPSSICELKSLETLDLWGNNALQSLDPGVRYMSTLKVLNIYDCHSLKSPPYDICRQGLKAIQTFYRNSGSSEFLNITMSQTTYSQQIQPPPSTTSQSFPWKPAAQAVQSLPSTSSQSFPYIPVAQAGQPLASTSSQSFPWIPAAQAGQPLPTTCSQSFPWISAAEAGQPLPSTSSQSFPWIPAAQAGQPPPSTSSPSFPWIPAAQAIQLLQSGSRPDFPFAPQAQFATLNPVEAPAILPYSSQTPQQSDSSLDRQSEFVPVGNMLPQQLNQNLSTNQQPPLPQWARSTSPLSVLISQLPTSPEQREQSEVTYHQQMLATEPSTSTQHQMLATEPSTSTRQPTLAAAHEPPLQEEVNYTGAVRGETIKLMISSKGELEIFVYIGSWTVEEFSTFIGTESGNPCIILDTDRAPYNRKTPLEKLRTPFIVKVGNVINQITELADKKRKHSESSEDEEVSSSYRRKRKEKKPLFGIVSSAQDAIDLLSYIHKQITERSLSIHKALHLPEVKKDRKTVDRFRNIYYLHVTNPEKLDQIVTDWKESNKPQGLGGLDETASDALDRDVVLRMEKEKKLTVFGMDAFNKKKLTS